MSKRGGDFVNKYEVMFIARPVEEAEVDPIVELVSNLLTKNGCSIEKVDRWGNAIWHTLLRNRLMATTF